MTDPIDWELLYRCGIGAYDSQERADVERWSALRAEHRQLALVMHRLLERPAELTQLFDAADACARLERLMVCPEPHSAVGAAAGNAACASMDGAAVPRP